jgi:hypothetical protein
VVGQVIVANLFKPGICTWKSGMVKRVVDACDTTGVISGQQHSKLCPIKVEYEGLTDVHFVQSELIKLLALQPPELEVVPPIVLGVVTVVKTSQLQSAAKAELAKIKNILKKLIIKNIFFITIFTIYTF